MGKLIHEELVAPHVSTDSAFSKPPSVSRYFQPPCVAGVISERVDFLRIGVTEVIFENGTRACFKPGNFAREGIFLKADAVGGLVRHLSAFFLLFPFPTKPLPLSAPFRMEYLQRRW